MEENTIYFDAEKSGWGTPEQIYCMIEEYGTGQAISFPGNPKTKMTDMGNGIWAYTPESKGVVLDDAKTYLLWFISDNQHETDEMLFDVSMLPDVAYTDEEYIDTYPNFKWHYPYWTFADESRYGCHFMISISGEPKGTAIPSFLTGADILRDFLERELQNAESISQKSAQELIDNIAAALGLSRDKVRALVAYEERENGLTISWDYEKSTLEIRESDRDNLAGDVNGDGSATVLDATRIQRYCAKLCNIDNSDYDPGTYALSEEAISRCDVTGDGVVSVLDATRIQRYCAKLCMLDGSGCTEE